MRLCTLFGRAFNLIGIPAKLCGILPLVMSGVNIPKCLCISAYAVRQPDDKNISDAKQLCRIG